MRKILRKKYWLQNMYRSVKRWVKACNKYKNLQPTHQGLLHPIRTSHLFEIVGIDILGPFKATRRGSKYILVFIDFFNNWVEACAIKSLEAEDVVRTFYRVIVTRHVCPSKVLTDPGTQLTAEVFKIFGERFGMELGGRCRAFASW